MDSSDRNWQRWGERDPYYAVLTDPRFHREGLAAAREDFFESGRRYVQGTLARMDAHFGAIPRGRALDFGCGVGRLTLPLAGEFSAVTGVDISPAMLDEARRNSAGLAIDYVLSDDSLSRIEGHYDFVSSCITLQHIPVKRGMALLALLLSRIVPGGGCAIHLSIGRSRRQQWGKRLVYAITHRVPGGQALFNLARGKSTDTPVMQMNAYPLGDVVSLFHAHGLRDLLLHYADHDGVDTVQIIARRF